MVVIGIVAIGGYLPQTSIDNVARASEAGKTVEFITDKVGFRTLPRIAPQEGVVDICMKAFADLQLRSPFDPASVDCLISARRTRIEGDCRTTPHCSSRR